MKKNKYCYLDACFLISYFVSGHQDYKSSRKMMFDLIKKKKRLMISTLALDETMFKVRENIEINQQNKKSFSDYYPDFKNIIISIENMRLIKIIQFKKNLNLAVRDVLLNIRDYNLRPRDAFHYAIMQDYSIKTIVTKDFRDFNRIPCIRLIPF